MRVATILDDTDVEILRQIVAQQGGSLPPSGALDENGANDAWFGSPPTIAGVSEAMLTSICRKLESFGLITSVRPREIRYGLKTVGLPFALLRKGKDFVEHIQGVASSSA